MADESIKHEEFLTMADYAKALDTVCIEAKHSLLVFEKDFVNIGFNDTGRTEILRAFLLASPKNKLQLLAHDTRAISQYCPRLMTLLQQFSHSMSIFQTPKHLQHISEPFAVADASSYARRFHFDHSRGMLALSDPSGARILKSKFDEMWQASQPGSGTASFVL